MDWSRRVRRVIPLGLVAVAVLATSRCSMLSSLTGPSNLTIQSFTASPTTVTAGSFTTLSWNVQGASSVSIDNSIGTVPAQGSRTVQLLWTTTFTLSAKSSNTSSQSTLQVGVLPAGGATTPSPSPSATPLPGTSPSPNPSSSPNTQGCGVPATGFVGSCTMRLAYPTTLNNGQCVQVNVVSATPDCPVSSGTVRSISLGITTQTNYTELFWQGGSGSADVLSPPSGTLNPSGVTTVNIQDTVGDSTMKFEIVDPSGNVLLRMTLSNL